MMNKLLVALLLLSVLDGFSQSQPKRVVGYYPDWQIYDRDKLASPKNIDYKRLSTVVYSFFVPQSSGELKSKDAYATELILKGERDWRFDGKPEYFPMTSLVELAHSKKTKVMISIGGWTGSEHFGVISSDSTKRATFVASCIALIDEYDVDGLDVDWEFPGKESTPYFTLLINDLRAALDKKTQNMKKRKKSYLLSIAISSSDKHMRFIEWNKIEKALDFINVMTYDFAGSWLPNNAHKSPIYSLEEDGDCIDRAISVLLDKYKLPAAKLNIGSSFACNALACVEGKNKLGDLHLGRYDKTTYATTKGQPTYYEVREKVDLYEERWDSLAKASYLIAKDGKSFVSYESERAIGEKVQLVKAKGLGGMVIWDITGDIIETKPGSGFVKHSPLLKAIYQNLKE